MNQCLAYLFLVLCQSFFLLDKLSSKAKESYLPLAKGLLALAKAATPNSGGRQSPHSLRQLKLCLSYSSVQSLRKVSSYEPMRSLLLLLLFFFPKEVARGLGLHIIIIIIT